MTPTFESRSRVVRLIYTVLKDLDFSAPGMTDGDIFARLAAEFAARADSAKMREGRKQRGKPAFNEPS